MKLVTFAVAVLAFVGPSWGAEDTRIASLLATLSRNWTERFDEADARREAARLGDAADAAVDAILRDYQLPRQTFSFRHSAVRVLEALASPKARKALIEIALARVEGSELPSQQQWASRAYVATLADKADARPLLASHDSGVLNSALLALQGQPVDKELLARLTGIMRGKDTFLRRNVADVLGHAPNADFPAEKVAAIVGAIPDVQAMPKANELWWPGSHTMAEGTYNRYIGALARMRGVDEALKEATPNVQGETRACLILARARRGDASVLPSVRAILQDPAAGMMRAWAAMALSQIGTAEDLPLVQKVAEADPLERAQGGCIEPDRKHFPIRGAAAGALEQLKARLRP